MSRYSFARFFLSVITVVLISGCSSRGDLYWGWTCGGDRRTGEWSCDQKLLQDGKAVDPDDFPPEQIPELPPVDISETVAGPTPPTKESDQTVVVSEDLDTTPQVMLAGEDLQSSQSWKNQLPALDGTSPETGAEAAPFKHSLQGMVPEPQTVRPSPAKASDASVDQKEVDIFKDGPPKADAYVAPTFGSKKVQLPKRPTVTLAAAEDAGLTNEEKTLEAPSVKVKSGSGYLIQLAALPTEQELDKFIAEHGLQSESLQRHYTYSRNHHWHVLTIGTYADYQTAQLSAEELVEKYSNLDTWIRSVKSIKNVSKISRSKINSSQD